MHHHIGTIVILGLALLYALTHLGHSARKYRANRHRSFWSRIWVSIPGPFGTRIGRRM
jgi:hypothetical protein